MIFGDAFGNADAVRAVAADFPDIAFVFGSDGGPADPNLSVFDNWIQEPAYLAGMLAGGLTKSNIIGVVGAMPIPEVNRLINAYIAGAKSVNDAVDVKVSFIDSFFDPAAAKEAALAQIGAGADVLYAERDGVIEAAQEKGVLAIGNMSDQSSLAPETVVTSVMWDMSPTVQYVLDQVAAGAYTAQDLGYFSSYAKGGAMLAPIAASVPQDLRAKVEAKEADIKSGGIPGGCQRRHPGRLGGSACGEPRRLTGGSACSRPSTPAPACRTDPARDLLPQQDSHSRLSCCVASPSGSATCSRTTRSISTSPGARSMPCSARTGQARRP